MKPTSQVFCSFWMVIFRNFTLPLHQSFVLEEEPFSTSEATFTFIFDINIV